MSALRSMLVCALLVLSTLLASHVDANATDANRLASPSFLPHYSIRADIRDAIFYAGGQAVYSSKHKRLFVAHRPPGYVYEGDALTVIDTRSGKYLKTWYGPYVEQLALSQDGDVLYAYSQFSDTVIRFDVATLTVLNEYPNPCQVLADTCEISRLAAGPDGLLYWTSWPPSVGVSDGATGVTLGTVARPDDTFAAGLALYGQSLYLLERTAGGSEDEVVVRFDLSQVTPELAKEVSPESLLFGLEVAANGSFLIAGGPREIRLLDPQSLDVTQIIPVKHPVVGGKSAVITSDSARIATLDGSEGHDRRYSVPTFDTGSGDLVLTAGLDTADVHLPEMNYVVPLDYNEVAILWHSRVLILHPSDHVAGIPLTFSNYCAGGRFTDSFNNANSGWPVGDTGSIVYRYDRSQYSIMLRPADRWTAVTRGDYWNDARQVQTRTWLPAKDGISGIVFGLNRDWSEFFTFEVIPSLRRWAIFHYSNGWKLWGSETSSAINPVGQSNTMSIVNDHPDFAFFTINGSLVHTMPAVPNGRVGLSGGSFEPDVDVRFDDYLFIGQNCPWNDRESIVERSPVITRPPLEMFGIDE